VSTHIISRFLRIRTDIRENGDPEITCIYINMDAYRGTALLIFSVSVFDAIEFSKFYKVKRRLFIFYVNPSLALDRIESIYDILKLIVTTKAKIVWNNLSM